jgi:hypothetical protein
MISGFGVHLLAFGLLPNQPWAYFQGVAPVARCIYTQVKHNIDQLNQFYSFSPNIKINSRTRKQKVTGTGG